LGDGVGLESGQAALGVVVGGPDDVAVGSGQFPGQAVGIVVVIVESAVGVNEGQGFEGAGVVDVFPGRLVFALFGEQGVAVPGKEGALSVPKLSLNVKI
jgi:hypothetical protein